MEIYNTEELQSLEIILKDGKIVEGELSNVRIDKTTVPKGLYCYDIRHEDDDDSIPSTLEKKVIANYYGTFITEEKIEFNDSLDFIEIVEWGYPEEM